MKTRTEQLFLSFVLHLVFKRGFRPGTGLRPVSARTLRRNAAERRASVLTEGNSSSSSLRHHNKLIPTLLTSHSRQSSKLGARQGRTRAQGKRCRATARLGLMVTRVLMAELLGDGEGDVSLRDVSPRDVSLCRAVARGQQPRSIDSQPLTRLFMPGARATSAETERGSNW